jgi:hypothetical protein
MADTADLLRDVLARLDALERDNEQLKQENQVLHRQIAVMRSENAPIPVTLPQHDGDGAVNRRQILQRGLQAAAATVAAGLMITSESNVARADADHTSTAFFETNGNYAVYAFSSGIIAVYASSDEGTGLYAEGRNAVWGYSDETGYGAIYGQHGGNDGTGVVGDGTGVGAGVLGRNGAGAGVRGEGRFGLYGKATVTNGYAAVLEGGKAQLRLVPSTTTGKPTSGSHLKGEIYLDRAGAIFVCTAPGTPGTWRKLSSTAV